MLERANAITKEILENQISNQWDATFYARLLITTLSTCFGCHSPIIRSSGTMCAAYGTVMLNYVTICTTVLFMGLWLMSYNIMWMFIGCGLRDLVPLVGSTCHYIDQHDSTIGCTHSSWAPDDGRVTPETCRECCYQYIYIKICISLFIIWSSYINMHGLLNTKFRNSRTNYVRSSIPHCMY
jgi:hypothetical protein